MPFRGCPHTHGPESDLHRAGLGKALLGMPVWLSKSTALGANSLQLGSESVHPAGAD